MCCLWRRMWRRPAKAQRKDSAASMELEHLVSDWRSMHALNVDSVQGCHKVVPSAHLLCSIFQPAMTHGLHALAQHSLCCLLWPTMHGMHIDWTDQACSLAITAATA